MLVNDLPGQPFECEASGAVKAGRAMADAYDARFAGMIISGGATVLLAGGTVVAWVLAPAKKPAGRAAQAQPLWQRLRVAPVWYPDGGGASVGWRF